MKTPAFAEKLRLIERDAAQALKTELAFYPSVILYSSFNKIICMVIIIIIIIIIIISLILETFLSSSLILNNDCHVWESLVTTCFGPSRP
jgi:hypothetical protein